MYDQYLQMPHIPLGAILDRILTKKKFDRHELAEQTGILYQYICDLISGHRRITLEISKKLEDVLGISISGFFFRIQSNYDSYSRMNKRENNYHPDLTLFRKALFWDTTIEKLDWRRNRHWIIRRVFEYGAEEEIKETIRFYGQDVVLQELRSIEDIRKGDIRERQINNYLLHR